MLKKDTKVKNLLIISFLLLLGSYGFGQDLKLESGSYNIPQDTVAMYTGGHFGYTSHSLTLFADSTYTYSFWYHSGGFVYDEGTYEINDSLITLCSKGYVKLKKKKNEKKVLFGNETYRMAQNKILLYTLQEEKKDKDSLITKYNTLYKKLK